MRCALLTDRITGVAYRLAGVEPVPANAENLQQRFQDTCQEYELVLITAPLAKLLPQEMLHQAIGQARPPVQVISPVYATELAPNVAGLARRSLGVK